MEIQKRKEKGRDFNRKGKGRDRKLILFFVQGEARTCGANSFCFKIVTRHRCDRVFLLFVVDFFMEATLHANASGELMAEVVKTSWGQEETETKVKSRRQDSRAYLSTGRTSEIESSEDKLGTNPGGREAETSERQIYNHAGSGRQLRDKRKPGEDKGKNTRQGV